MDLKKIRLERNWSQDQLADITGVSTRTIQRIENDNPPSLETLKALAAGLDMSVEELKDQAASEPQSGDDDQVETGGFALAFKDWQGFMLHVAIFMGVITWLLILQQYFAIDKEIIGVVGLIWGAVLANHLSKTVSRDTHQP